MQFEAFAVQKILEQREIDITNAVAAESVIKTRLVARDLIAGVGESGDVEEVVYAAAGDNLLDAVLARGFSRDFSATLGWMLKSPALVLPGFVPAQPVRSDSIALPDSGQA